VQFEDRAFRVVTDSYVTDEDGTGIVHQAPAFGEDDHRIAIANGIVAPEEVPPCPLDDVGRFVKPVVDYEGMYIKASVLLVLVPPIANLSGYRMQIKRFKSS